MAIGVVTYVQRTLSQKEAHFGVVVEIGQIDKADTRGREKREKIRRRRGVGSREYVGLEERAVGCIKRFSRIC